MKLRRVVYQRRVVGFDLKHEDTREVEVGGHEGPVYVPRVGEVVDFGDGYMWHVRFVSTCLPESAVYVECLR